ncbi:MAG: O-antigen ligase family protein [Flavobacteriaceae bacterium]|nr:O-antigen ligase family protein [Flavobacteriaceae bacterium]
MFFLFLLLKKGPVLGLLLGILTFVLLKNKKQIWYLFFSIIFVCFLLVLTSSKIRQKFIELIKIETVNEKDVETTSSNIRYSLYKYGLETFKESFLFGHGIGDYRDKLIESYKDNPVLFNEKYNTHNQYLSFLISLGIIGFLIFLVSIGINLKQAYKKGNHILMVILIFYCFVMITENILEREDGVLYFSFFICFFNTIHVIESEEKPSIVNT